MLNERNVLSHESSQTDRGSEKAMKTLAGMTPWVLSLLFHLSLFLIFIFVVFFTMPDPAKAKDIIPLSPYMEDSRINIRSTEIDKGRYSKPIEHKRSAPKRPNVFNDTSQTKTPLDIISPELSSVRHSESIDINSSNLGALGKKHGFFTAPAPAFNIVYVLDGSGSMMVSGAFEVVRTEMYRSIYKLSEKQAFNIIIYTGGKPVEWSDELKLASRENKVAAAKFLGSYTGEGASNPIPALERAFKNLEHVKRPGRLIYLLSDGEFRSSDNRVTNEAVVAKIRSLNAGKKVFINALLFGTEQPEAVEVMLKIANQNKGHFKYIKWNE